MSTQIKHDSRSTLYRLPGGAMPAGSGVRIRLWASRAFKQVFLRVWTDCEQKIPMRALGYQRVHSAFDNLGTLR